MTMHRGNLYHALLAYSYANRSLRPAWTTLKFYQVQLWPEILTRLLMIQGSNTRAGNRNRFLFIIFFCVFFYTFSDHHFPHVTLFLLFCSTFFVYKHALHSFCLASGCSGQFHAESCLPAFHGYPRKHWATDQEDQVRHSSLVGHLISKNTFLALKKQNNV